MKKTEKLQKVLANLGFGSRREIEKIIAAGRVMVNCIPAKLGDRVDDTAEIYIDGKPAKQSSASVTRVLIYNKPLGELCTRTDPEGRATVFANLPALKNLRWISIGRLDINTSGLLLFTTNGELANFLMHPSNEIPREYEVEFVGNLDQRIIDRLINGVELEDGKAHVEQIKLQKNGCARVTLTEGRNRIVRRLFASQGLKVTSLRRVRFGKIMLPENLKVGEWRELTEREITNYKLREKITDYK